MARLTRPTGAVAQAFIADVWNAVDVLRDILENKSWDRPEFRERDAVT